MIFLAQMPTAPQMPPLPEGPSLDRVRGPIAIPAYEPWQIILALGFVFLFIGLLIWLVIRNRRKTAKTTSPHETALAELQAAANLSAEDDERFAVMSSRTLRRYLEDEFGLPSTARTTEEFLLSLKGNTQFDESFQTTLREMLANLDQTKFSQQPISIESRIHITGTLRELINQAQVISEKKGSRL
ncbi:MAG: OadG family protein [Verrucomicrobiota bacterium]|nr:OadG family protein [Verrucomicrobiota bacterium]